MTHTLPRPGCEDEGLLVGNLKEPQKILLERLGGAQAVEAPRATVLCA